MEWLNEQALLILAIFIISSIFHGLTGVGVTIIATMALASFYPMPYVLILTVIPCLVINLVVFLDGGQVLYYLKKYWLLALTSFVGSYLGTQLVFIIAQHYLLLALGILIIFYVMMQFISIHFKRKLTIPNTPTTLVLSGTIAGVLGGATNAMSPLLIMYLLSATEQTSNPKIELIKASNLCYMIGKIAQLIVLWSSLQSLPNSNLMLIGVSTFVCMLFLYLGLYFRNKLSQTLFRNLVLIILFILGIKSFIHAIG